MKKISLLTGTLFMFSGILCAQTANNKKQPVSKHSTAHKVVKKNTASSTSKFKTPTRHPAIPEHVAVPLIKAVPERTGK